MMSVFPTAPRALIADDQVEVLEALRLLLKGEGIQAHGVTSPAAVLEALASQHFDILLMDLNYARDTTSGHEGLDLLERIVAFDSSLPVIVMTGWGSVELAVETMRRGVRDFVQKPWDNERLLQILRTHIAHGQALRKGRHLDAEAKALRTELRNAADVHALLRRAAEHLQSGLRIESVVIFIRGSMDQSYWAAAQTGLTGELSGRIRFDSAAGLIKQLQSLTDPRTLELPESEKQKIHQTNAAILAPLRFEEDVIGFLCLGPRFVDESYDADDLKFLHASMRDIAESIETLKLKSQEREYAEAKEIQQGLLPKEIAQIAGYEIFGAWQPASAVGGDYFDVLKLSPRKVALCIADVVGKGLPAALLMSNLQAAVKAFASEYAQPRDLCTRVNQVISSNIAANKFITFFYCVLDSSTGTMRFANAGHNPPIILRKNAGYSRLLDGGAVLGVFKDWQFEQSEIEFLPGDRVVLFTDGVTEVLNSEGEEFGEDRLVELLERNRGLQAKELHAIVMEAIADFGGHEFQDDATLLVMSRD